MPRGKGRRPAPPGYMTPAEAGTLLGENRLYKLVKDQRLKRHTPEGYQHGYYSREEVQAILDAEAVFFGAHQETPPLSNDAIFAVATQADMDALYAMAVKLFPKTADAERRRSWLRKEPRGHYIIKRIADGAVMAYLYLLPLRAEYLTAYLHDELPSRGIDPDEHIEGFTPGVPSSACIIGGIGSDPDVEQELRTTYTALLLRGVRKEMGNLGREGITIPKLYSFSERAEGIAMCARLGMEQWEPPRGKWCTFVLDVPSSHAVIIRDYKQGLAEWQTIHQPQRATTPNSGVTSHHPPKTREARSRSSEGHSEASTKQDIPEGWASPSGFAKRHGVREATLTDAVKNGRVPSHPGDWKEGRATAKFALDPDEQQACYLYIRNLQNFHQCDVPGCPCRQEQPE